MGTLTPVVVIPIGTSVNSDSMDKIFKYSHSDPTIQFLSNLLYKYSYTSERYRYNFSVIIGTKILKCLLIKKLSIYPLRVINTMRILDIHLYSFVFLCRQLSEDVLDNNVR